MCNTILNKRIQSILEIVYSGKVPIIKKQAIMLLLILQQADVIVYWF